MILIHGLDEYTKKSKERLITTDSNTNGNVRLNRKATKTRKTRKKKTVRIFPQQTWEITHEKTWT